jgi:hypothetical protein
MHLIFFNAKMFINKDILLNILVHNSTNVFNVISSFRKNKKFFNFNTNSSDQYRWLSTIEEFLKLSNLTLNFQIFSYYLF